MAGSKRWLRYQNDAGASFSVQMDESNGEATVGGVALMTNRTAAHPRIGSTDQMRYVMAYVSATPSIKRKFWVGNPLAIAQIQAGGVLSAGIYPSANDAATVVGAWTITAYRGEKFSPAPALNTTAGDTGLTDGDAARDA